MTTMPPVMRYHGGKSRIAEWVIDRFPAHKVYVEPFGGAANILMQKAPVRAEIYNDLDGEIVNVFRVLREPATAERLAELCRLTPYARAEFDLSQEPTSDPVEQARRTLFRAWASFGSAGATRGNSGMRTFSRPDGSYLGVAKAWNRIAGAIDAFTDRLRDVVIENRPALNVIAQYDSLETLHYVDPPYLPETRTYGSGRYYRHEMTVEDHGELLEGLQQLQGFVILSGYESRLYDERLAGWQRLTLATSGSSRMGSVKRTECLWLSPRVVEAQRQQDIFAGGAA
ncbi:DNA adenine methylase [Billgrantia ethanolica]|uniref:DNA adenine methylase n=1 Tax=Billgrantia ethanolica TaxID=2733486 RepID=A0ABS9A159_9GAMM|nr:DNA adenine methylase [Halomonas ethanolica]MCE8002566.1 DNA adenine methylase [Halomonas ethanolica]